MPKVELPYTEEGVKMAKELKPQVESIGGELDFDTYDASQRSQSVEGYAYGGSVKPTYKAGGKLSAFERNQAAREAAKKSKVDQGQYKTTKKGFLSPEGRKQKRIDTLAKKRAGLEKGSAAWTRVQNRINKLSGVSKRHKKPEAVITGKPSKKPPLYKSKSEKGDESSRHISKKKTGKGLKDMAFGSAERIAEYKKRDWAMDDTTHQKKKVKTFKERTKTVDNIEKNRQKHIRKVVEEVHPELKKKKKVDDDQIAKPGTIGTDIHGKPVYDTHPKKKIVKSKSKKNTPPEMGWDFKKGVRTTPKHR